MPALFVIDKKGSVRFAQYGAGMSDIPLNQDILRLPEKLKPGSFLQKGLIATFMVGPAFLPVINGLKSSVRDRQECLFHQSLIPICIQNSIRAIARSGV